MRYVNKLIILIIVLVSISGCEDYSQNTRTGVGGSTARYAIEGNYLYVINDLQMHVYNIMGTSFEEVAEIEIGSGVETITSRPGFLYLGSMEGMHIYDLTNPGHPEFRFRYDHIFSCDPVVVQGNRAYLTLSAGSICGARAINALEIIDITDPNIPFLIKQYPMTSPRGLGVDGNLLFVAEGKNGIKMYDITDEENISLVTTSSVDAFDVIAADNILTVTGEQGIFQYQYSTGDSPLSLLSTIPVSR
jgi:hypothetical protein